MERLYSNCLHVRNYFIVAICLTFFLLFTSCENFMDSSAKDDLTQQIYIGNHECPAATVEEPVFSDGGVAKNKAIIISFSIPVNPETFESSFKIVDSEGNNLRENFIAPQWANDNKLVTIAADELNLIDLHGQKTLDITVTLSTGCKTLDNLPLKSAINHKYRICENVDNTPPEISNETFAERPEISFGGNLISNAITLKEGTITSESEAEICKANHINTKAKFYIEGSDYGGGSVKGHITCQRIKSVTGENVTAPVEDYIVNLTKQADTGLSTGEYELDLTSAQKYQDGMYEVKVYIQDSYALDSETYKVYYLIRDTSLAYCVTSRFVNDIPNFRNDNENEVINAFNSQTPTLRKLEDYKTRIFFDKISDDTYYTSALTNKVYGNEMAEFSYYLSWGLSLDTLTDPVKLIGDYTDDETITQAVNVLKIYDCPAAFLQFIKDNENEDIIVCANVVDCAGNQNEIIALYPKKISFTNYLVSDNATTGKKNVHLNFADALNNKTIPNNSIYPKCRIFYGPLNELSEDDDLSDVPLKRNPALPFDQDIYDKQPDSNDLINLEPDSKYVVYLQALYESFSILNGQWNATTHGPLCKVIIDTSKTCDGVITTPVFTVEKKSSGVNTGMFNIKVRIDDTVYNNNKDLGVKYIPYFKPDSKFEDDYTVTRKDAIPWTSYEAHTEQEFTFTVKNPLRAPLGYNESWDNNHWDGPINLQNQQVEGDYTYIEAVKSCKQAGLEYTDIPAYVKILAVKDDASEESAEKTIYFVEDDDNIPPRISGDIILHDSQLSFDGHSFEFNDLIREDEGHASEYFKWYYAPYNPAWGDNLSVLSPEEIETLPGGVATYTGSTWFGHYDTKQIDETTTAPNPHGAMYKLSMNIPVFGIPDGEYLFFAKITDTYGNYTYVTLGKGNIGTFKNKLKVEVDEDKKFFISSLELEGNERSFDRNMINIQHLNIDWNKPVQRDWDNQYGWLNELQECDVKTEGGKTLLYYHHTANDKNIFLDKTGQNNGQDIFGTKQPDPLSDWTFYRITMQSFNENTLVGYWGENGQPVITKEGVDRIYGRPYNYTYNESTDNYENVYSQDVLWYVDGETKYDVCTQETVSNTVYYYVPGNDEDFNDFYASFFASTAIVRSNHNFIVNVIASSTDLGNDISEWERRGKLIKTHYYSPNDPTYIDENGVERSNPYYNEIYDNTLHPFDYNTATADIADSHEKGLIYYVAIAHFADGSSAISDVYTMYGF